MLRNGECPDGVEVQMLMRERGSLLSPRWSIHREDWAALATALDHGPVNTTKLRAGNQSITNRTLMEPLLVM